MKEAVETVTGMEVELTDCMVRKEPLSEKTYLTFKVRVSMTKNELKSLQGLLDEYEARLKESEVLDTECHTEQVSDWMETVHVQVEQQIARTLKRREEDMEKWLKARGS